MTTTDTSRAALESVRSHLSRLQQRIYSTLARAGAFGLIAADLEAIEMLPGNTVRPRLRELENLGLIRKTSRKRKTYSGREARVYVAVSGVL